MQPLKILAGAMALSTLTACATSGIHNSPAMQQLYAVEADPVDQWPAQNQRDISILKADFANRYQRDYPRSEVYSDAVQLTECSLKQERALQVGGISPDMVTPPSKTDNLINDNSVKYERISVRSTAAGCASLREVELHVVPNIVANIKRLPDDTDYPVYVDAAYKLDLQSRVKVGGKWKKIDYGVKRISVKRYRDKTGIAGFPYAESLWQKTDTLRQGDTDTSRFREDPMYLVTYFANEPDHYMDIVLLRQTMLNKTGNNITMRWKDGDDTMTRTWTRKGMVISQKNGKRHGIFSFPVDNQPPQVLCHDAGKTVDYFRRQGPYDCSIASKQDYGQEGVFVDPTVSLREELDTLRQNHPNTEPVMASTASSPAASEPDTATNTLSNTASECSKAYAARKACEKIPGDPFGIAMKLCLSQAKKKFGGMDCPVSF